MPEGKGKKGKIDSRFHGNDRVGAGMTNVGVRFIEPAKENYQNKPGRINPTPTKKSKRV